ncbi:16S rRNA (guanine(966)-N(2))-methyltransferase RsmD [Marinobacter sp. X15-166B]|uniref:16S rRNA (guanine(966)-N(2))-methyltransferase RsmD n=1 Tax=Marinobacter sp. X15-166B TaxID=1897620 RepID=UPI00085BD485|nr:16S rRNA (guanine(966)-N(2))-methyltransferase RsmD [Marinobacter sp. X15-166B]OEY67917.1 16S rRNA (guanine(966)-N(2))-methyltransferase RsmD [Marinobacter sp. X15-166B]
MARKKPTRHLANPSTAASGELRIIGGEWRSRKLRFPAVGGVRPTPARTRETLFNWLTPYLPGSHCLDLFAGSGALGLEALSRGAETALLVDHNTNLTRALQANLGALKCTRGKVLTAPAEHLLGAPASQAFDIIFMDPPFRQGLLDRLLPFVDTHRWLAPGGWIYIEYESGLAMPLTPAHWHLHRQKTAGQVTYCLYRNALPA